MWQVSEKSLTRKTIKQGRKYYHKEGIKIWEKASRESVMK